ncbi:F-box/kelch-repeat protein At3g06240-like [Papaver somniferum]|uniref:F-box/kelch-repeat protein At3g06240-like n=1 Tax=Papaver somniferum TaxID=3469 RepID=UPI000E6FC43C|nr:F-box/kelch-repeat protein At3g06240-like [Papaver somniferum]
MSSSSIPGEIQEDIILRLPVKSISRFKSVCKSWCRYINSPTFIKHHLVRTSKNPRIMIRDAIRGDGTNPFYIVDYDSISSGLSSRKCEPVARLNYPVSVNNGVRNPYVDIVGSCNGLLCVIAPVCDTPIIWNPSTTEYKEIILPPPDNHLRWVSYGFGYDRKINDYKLVCLSWEEVYIYRLRSSSSRKLVKNIPCGKVWEPAGLLLNGALHWTLAANAITGEISKIIVVFDISSEKFMSWPFPEEIVLRTPDSSCYLQVFENSLCIISSVHAARVDVWVMQNYGVTESWTKPFTTAQERITNSPYSLELYWYCINGDILILVEGRFGIYDQKNDRIKFLNINGLDDGYTYGQPRCVGGSYVESLVSLNSGTYMRKRRN